MKGIDNVSLFKIAHTKTRNFRKVYKVSYAVQLGIFLKEVYKLKRIIEERVVKACKSLRFNLMEFRVVRIVDGKPVITIKYKMNRKVFVKRLNEILVDEIWRDTSQDFKLKVALREIYQTTSCLLNSIKDEVKERINFDEYIPSKRCSQMSLF